MIPAAPPRLQEPWLLFECTGSIINPGIWDFSFFLHQQVREPRLRTTGIQRPWGLRGAEMGLDAGEGWGWGALGDGCFLLLTHAVSLGVLGRNPCFELPKSLWWECACSQCHHSQCHPAAPSLPAAGWREVADEAGEEFCCSGCWSRDGAPS